ncbi:aminoacylase-1-like [Contarinia nasturtii]|uniref:aminoacylase-1-like n=1 Tax=Contarinia nasturtii TaxID=265458 RepID=UPI0012D449EB|nr:aminoacylase-1-like [Contarinia nasturtii]
MVYGTHFKGTYYNPYKANLITNSTIVKKSKMEPRQKCSVKVILTSIIIVCVIVAVGVGVFFYTTRTKCPLKETQEQDANYNFNDSTPATAKWVKNEEIQLFRRYLRFKTISLETDFDPCINFLKKQADDLGFEVSIFHPVNKQNPVLVMTWKGSEPELPSIMLNSHMDVVPAAEEYWTHPPFAAEIDENGNIYARGAQDMKSVGMQYLAAARALKRKGIIQLKRTIHLTYMPDEEVSGFGMGPFVESDAFKKMNVGFGLDEGYPSETDDIEVFYAEKPDWVVNVVAQGHSGHASILFDDTAAEKLNYVVNKFLELRKNETAKWKEQKYPYGNVTAINLTILNGGFRDNVVPPEMRAVFDMRMAIDADWDEFERMIKRWARETGKNVTVDIIKDLNPPPTPIDDSNYYWLAFKQATDELRLNVTPSVFRAVTDSRYVRNVGIPALGFSPLMNTTPKLHEHDEYINADTYLNGIKIYEKIIEKIGNVEKMPIRKMKIGDVNELSSSEFEKVFKNVVELWPRAAKSVVRQRPFGDLNQLLLAFSDYLENLSVDDKLAVLKSHPDLAGKLLDENQLSQESANEQSGAGLHLITDKQKEQLVKLNTEYSEKFGFPFVICVRQNNKIERILEGFVDRLPNTRNDEIKNGINEVKKICQLRIEDLVE